jgi:acyl-CoA synthetase (AMP-forming)/AMP-acid ligase II
MRGYCNRPEASKRFQDAADPEKRSLRTGDLLRQDDEGFFYFVARRDDIIKSRGEKVAPKEIENVLYSLEGVTEASVVGVPDPILGEAIKALVVVNGAALTPQEILRHCRLHLEDFMVPQIIELRDGLPKTASGKISRVPGGV